MCSYQPAPFFVLDEIDAALDNVNIKRVSMYVAIRYSYIAMYLERTVVCSTVMFRSMYVCSYLCIVGVTESIIH